MTRRRISTKERLQILIDALGECHICKGRISAGQAWDVEHVIPLAQGGDDEGDNLRPAHRKCHAAKSKQDATNTARMKRREAFNLGAKAPSRNPLPGSKASGWRRRMNGKVERW